MDKHILFKPRSNVLGRFTLKPGESGTEALYTKTSRHLNSYLHAIVECLKEAPHPLTVDEIKDRTGIAIDEIKELHEAVMRNEKIKKHNGKLEFIAMYKIQTREDLLAAVQNTAESHGILISELKEAGIGVEELVAELGESRDIVCISQKDDPDIAVFKNPNKHRPYIDTKFQDMWHKTPFPLDEDIEKELVLAGLSGMNVLASPLKRRQVQTKKKNRQKRFKLTNTHLEGIDLTKDYE